MSDQSESEVSQLTIFLKILGGVGIAGILFAYGYAFVFMTPKISSDDPVGVVFMILSVVFLLFTIFTVYNDIRD